MDNGLTIMKKVEEIIGSLYGEKNSHEEYLEIYKKLLEKNNIEQKKEFIKKLINYLEINDNFQSSLTFVAAVTEYFSFMNASMNLVIDSLKENKNLNLACLFMRFTDQFHQIKLIDLMLDSNEDLKITVYAFSYKENEEYILNKLIKQDKFKEACELVEYLDMVNKNFIDYFIKKIENNFLKKEDELKKIVELYIHSKNIRSEKVNDFIVKRYSAKDIRDFMIKNENLCSLITPFFQILISDDNLEYLSELLEKKKWIFSFNEKEINLLEESNNIDLLILIYKEADICDLRKESIYLKIFEILLECNDVEKIKLTITYEDLKIFNPEKRKIYENYLIRNGLGDDLIYWFINRYSINDFEVLKNINSFGLISTLKDEFNTLDEEKLYSLLSLMNDFVFNLKEYSEKNKVYSSFAIYREIIEIVKILNNLIYSRGIKNENLESYALKYEEEFNKGKIYIEKKPNVLQRVRTIFVTVQR